MDISKLMIMTLLTMAIVHSVTALLMKFNKVSIGQQVTSAVINVVIALIIFLVWR